MRIVITGASRGIGQAMMKAYQRAGHEVTGTGRQAGTDLFPLDVTDPASPAVLAAHLGARPVDLLVCNAGIYSDKGQNLETGFAAPLWAEGFATNVTGVFLTIQALLPHLLRAPAAKIAIISSQMGSDTRAPGGSYIYRASKAAALNLGRNLAVDLRPRGIAVGIYHPGWVQTDMGGSAADITVDESASGLVARFAALGLETTGCFETWDGRPHPF
ncbi:MAG: SDR family oxidoreductase [Paracoccaceae bacterium]|uniref:SDR family oxidoreductase n=1 Tax=Seohaeicola saemankumensis TaxID=481181 RepID=UPI001E57E893|nr:SDR family oxidoreductase [Seohaeicola saemankumensis]MCD1625411.1 SDR family oxidoreductase [Seohaeicola saemankumensis]